MLKIVDLFAGAGGESTGIIQALNGARYDLAAVNHWAVAIETHRRNHPSARHFQADIQHLNPLDVFGARDKIDLLWASPECTHHSIARGGRPRSDQSRASAWLILKWLSELYVRHVILENVPEFESWGPLGSDGRPLVSKKGATFQAFVAALRSLGYTVEWNVLCSADYGDLTTRRRLFLQAVRGGARIVWPKPTHAKHPGLVGLRPWRPARDVIDWSLRGKSIFSRARPLVPATMSRIEAGIRRFRGEGEPFLVPYYGTSGPASILEPLATITTRDRFALIEGRGSDITFRMLQPHELAKAQGFPASYWFAGSGADQVKQIGNAVTVGTARALAESVLSA